MSAADADTAMPQGMDPDVWATMTEEERAGIASSDYSEQEISTMKRIVGDAGDDSDDSDDGDDDDADDGSDGGDDDDAGDSKGADADDGKPAAGSDAGDGDEGAAEKPSEQEPAAQVVPRYEAKLPDDFNDRVSALSTAEAEAWQKFNDGDLDQAGLQSELGRIATERAELHAIKVKAEISQEMNAQTVEQTWAATVNRAIVEFSKPENGGIDYRKDTAKMADLDQFVKLLANNEANSDKPMEWFLHEAHRRVQALHGISSVKPPPGDANKRREPAVKNIPPSLANVPGGDGPGDVAGEFADIDSLDGEELESAISRMTPAQRERYAKGR